MHKLCTPNMTMISVCSKVRVSADSITLLNLCTIFKTSSQWVGRSWDQERSTLWRSVLRFLTQRCKN